MKAALKIFALLLLACLLPGQAPQEPRFSAGYTHTLTSAPAYFTIQLPANSQRRIFPVYAIVECSVECTVSQDVNGNAANETEMDPTRISGSGYSPVAEAYRSSNAGFGSAVGIPFTAPAATVVSIDLSSITMEALQAGVQNYNLRISSITGTARTAVIWAEK